jgi:hypothetical protein
MRKKSYFSSLLVFILLLLIFSQVGLFNQKVIAQWDCECSGSSCHSQSCSDAGYPCGGSQQVCCNGCTWVGDGGNCGFKDYSYSCINATCTRGAYECNNNVWCSGSNPCPTSTPAVTPYPTVAVSGLLKEYLGVGSCPLGGISTGTLSVALNPQIPAGVTTNCGITPPAGQTKSSYRCTAVFNALSNPAQNLNLSASATGYSSAYWTAANACTDTTSNSLPVNVSSGGSTVYDNKDIFFKNVTSWIKLKNSSFSSLTSLNNVIPLNIVAYDAADDNASQRYFIINSAGNDPGLVAASSINTGTADVSSKNWGTASADISIRMRPSDFLSYVRSRKEYTTVSNLGDITTNNYNKQILVLTGPITIDNTNKSIFDNKSLVLIINGNLNLNFTTFNPTGGYVAFLSTGTITFASTTTEARGIFISPTVDLGTNSNLGIKIIGNLVALNNLINGRQWTDNSKPSVFVVFDQSYYINLLPYLSTANYQMSQTQ